MAKKNTPPPPPQDMEDDENKNENPNDKNLSDEEKKALESKFEINPEEEKKPKKVIFKPKGKFSIDDLRNKLGNMETDYKPDSWIHLGPAFQEVTQLPGIPQGSMTMVFGHSDTGKSTLGLELIKACIDKNVLPIVINTEKKWNWAHVNEFGIEKHQVIYNDSCDTVEMVAEFIKDILKRQLNMEIESDIMFIWDSIGNSISKAELKADEEGDTAAMMATAKVINQQFFRIIEKKISATKRANFPYFASLFTITHAYISGQSLVYYGGEGIYKGSTLVFRMGGVISKATDLYATKQGVDLVFARKTQIVTVKNHITNIKTKGTIVCVHNGFIRDDKKDIDEYKKTYRDDWDIKFTEDWAKYNKDSK
jgi:hypothetical protein